MKSQCLYTKSGARLRLVRPHKAQKSQGPVPNWLFLPGGPGLGSESLSPLTDIFSCPGNLWHLDLPGDGSNLLSEDTQAFSHWSQALVEATEALDHVILVAHSTGGMFALSTPLLEKSLIGLALMDSSPDASWQGIFMEYAVTLPLPELMRLHKLYEKNPNNQLLKDMTIASIPYLCAQECAPEKFHFLKDLPYNFITEQWSSKNFDATYQAQWIPKEIPTLIIGGDQDHITPLSLFRKSSRFQRSNITIAEIPQAGHFPWIENPFHVNKTFEEYFDRFICLT